jgi:PAS domain S-box-containing protein
MSSSAPSPATVLAVFDALDSPGTPLTTPEVADEFDCTNRTIYNKLETLVADGSLETKKVGARGRVWWQPPHDREQGEGDDPSVTPDETTERTEIERELERTRDLLMKTERIADVGGWEIDPESKEVFWTDHLFDLLEFPDDEEPSLEKALDIYHEDDRPAVEDAVETALDAGEPFDMDVRYRPASGDLRWLRVQGVPETVDGDVTTLRGAVQDITERKQAEQQRQMLAAVVENSNDFIGLSTPDGEVLYVNEAGREMVGLDSPEHVRQTHVLDYFVPDDRPFIEQEAMPQLQQDGQWSGQVQFRHFKTQETIPTLWNAFVIRNQNTGEPLAWATVSPDLTDLKQTEEALYDSEERLRLALDAGEMGAWEIDLQSDDPAIRSPRHDEIFGYEDPVEDWHFEEESLDHVHPDDRERVEADFESALETGDWETECRIIRTDGEQRWIAAQAEVYYDNGNPARVIGTVEDITERKEREQRLAHQREQIEQLKDRLLDTSPTGILLLNEAGEITLANDRAQEILGMPSEDIIGLSHNAPEFGIVDLNGEPIPEEEMPFERVRTTGDAIFGIELGATQPDDQRIWLSMNAAPLHDDSAGPTETIIAFEEITERKQATDALEHLNTISRDLMDADPQTISERAADITREVLDVTHTSVWRYDEDTGELQLHTSSTAADIDPDSIRSPEEFEARAWQTFVSSEIDASNELSPAPDSGGSEESIRSGVIVPLGRHGVICAGSLSPVAFDETAVNLASTVGATIETALDRAANEQELARHNEELTRLDQINGIIRNIDQALVHAETREEIEQVVCEQLATSERYHSAWIGEYDLDTETITPQEWAGIDASYFETLTDTSDDTALGQGPIGTAAQTHEVQVIEDIVTDARFAPWREQTLDIGARACLVIPLVYNETLYGVVTVYTTKPQPTSADHTVLGELGETIAHAINAVETRETLHTDSVVELELHFQAPDTPLCRLAQQADCRIECEGLVPQTDGPSQVFFTAKGVSQRAIQTAGETTMAIEALVCLSEREKEVLCKAEVAASILPSRLVEQNARIRTLTIDGETATAVVDLPSTAAVREFIETLQTHYPTADLRSRRTRDRPIDTSHGFMRTIDDRLTARQQDILQMAYLSGFFQSPRESTGKEIAAMLDISPPTFTQHLRAGQHNLFELLFDEM